MATKQKGQKLSEAFAEAAGKPLNLKQMEALVTEYRDKRRAYEAAKKELNKGKYADYLKAEAKILRVLQDAQKTSYKANIGLVSVKSSTSVKVPKTIEDKKKFFAYLKQLGPDVFWSKVGISSSTLNSWYKKLQEQSKKPVSVPGITEGSIEISLAFKEVKQKGQANGNQASKQ